MPEKKVPIGIINFDEDLTELIQLNLEGRGYNCVSENILMIKRNIKNYNLFLKQYNPRVLIIEVPVPYEENWKFLKRFRSLPESQGRGFVFITTDKRQLDLLAGSAEQIEIVAMPFDIDQLADTVEKVYHSDII